MDGRNGINRMVSEDELLAIVKDLNSLFPEEVVAELLKYAPGYYRELLTEGKLLLTATYARDFATEGFGKWQVIGKVSDHPGFEGAILGFLAVDTTFVTLVHSSKKGTRRFTILSWPEGERMDPRAKGQYFLVGNTSEDMNESDA